MFICKAYLLYLFFRFLNIVSVPEALKNTSAIENEMSQLEDTRNFQLALYAKVANMSCEEALQILNELILPTKLWTLYQDHPEQSGGGEAGMSTGWLEA